MPPLSWKKAGGPIGRVTAAGADNSFSKDEWHQRLHLFLVSWIIVGKMPQQEPFFLREFDPKTDGDHRDGQTAVQLAVGDGRAKAHHQQARVNGMARKTIRPRPHQFVALLESDVAAPISRERPACPDGHPQTIHADGGTDEQCPVRAWDQFLI